MASFPTSNRPFPAYPAGYRYAPATAPTPWPNATPGYQQPSRPAFTPSYPTAFNAPHPAATPQPWPMATNPQAFGPFAPHPANRFFPPFGQPHLPWFSNMFAPQQPQQPMVISLNTPKMSREDIRKNFLMKVAATTTSLVVGLGIIAFVGLKILPQRIAMELREQAHKSLLNTLDESSFKEVLQKIQDSSLTTDANVSKELKRKWGNKHAGDIFKNKKERIKFLTDIEPHHQINDTLGKIGQQIWGAAVTPQFIKQQMVTINDATLTPEGKQALLNKFEKHENVQNALKNSHYAKEGNKLARLSRNDQDAIMREVYKHSQITDTLAVTAQDVKSSVFGSLNPFSWYRSK